MYAFYTINLMVNIITKNTYDEVSFIIALYIKNSINNHTKESPFILGLPTGATPIGVYKYLVQFYKSNELSFKNVVTFNMDEYCGLPKTHSQSYYTYMYTHLFNHVDIKKDNINLLDGNTDNHNEACQKYEYKIQYYGGIDLFLGGIGTDGHIAFNNPGSSYQSKTRLVKLSKSTIDSNSHYFDSIEEMPTHALSVGINTIMSAKQIILMATGINKANIIKEIVGQEPSLFIPCSVISHSQYQNKVILAIDSDAGSKINNIYNTFNILNNDAIQHSLIKQQFKNIFDSYNTRILITSPHPDDDVIAMAGTMFMLDNYLYDSHNKINVTYLTNGLGGLYDKDKTNNPISLRIKEAQNAIECLGYNHHQVIDWTLPFYNRKDRKTTQNDVDKMKQLIDAGNYSDLFVCCDPDPKGTHIKCLNILKSIKKLTNIRIWLYKSAWESWSGEETHTFYFDESVLDKKKQAIMSHKSQHSLKVNNGNIKGLTDIVNNYTISPTGLYNESFKLLNPIDFYKEGLLDINYT